MATLIGFAPVKTCGFPDFGPDSEGHMGFVRGEPCDSKAGVGLQMWGWNRLEPQKLWIEPIKTNKLQ